MSKSLCVAAFAALAISLSVVSVLAQAPVNFSAAQSSVPRLIRFSGLLKDANNNAVSGNVNLTFSIYKDQDGGTSLWSEKQNVEADAQGSYSAMLGAGSSAGLPVELFSGAETRWLGIRMGEAAEQARILLLSVPYALKAADAETLGGKPLSAFVLAGSSAAPSTTTTSTTATVGKSAVANTTTTTIAPPVLPPITGQGTISFIPKFSTATTIANSSIFDNGNVGIGTITPKAKLDVVGSIRISGAGGNLVFPDKSVQSTATLRGPAGPAGPVGQTGPTGPTGSTGAQGPMGMTGATGPQGSAGVGLTNRGPWNNATSYNPNDAVSFGGSYWLALIASTGAEPDTSPSNWQLVASKGDVGTAGAVGPSGPPGAQGPGGPQGPQGPQGSNGATGATGSQGPAGATGAAGPQGPLGPTGATGAQGATGPAGPLGLTNQGPWNVATSYNPNDAVSYGGSYWIALTANSSAQPDTSPSSWQLLASKGDAGAAGANGPAGATGAQGPVGAVGAQGPAGATGAQGPAGATGAQGPAGATGATGASGVVTVQTFGGLISSIPGNETTWGFAGPTTLVTTTVGQRMTASAAAPMGLASGGPQTAEIDMCYQTSTGGALSNFVGANYSIVQIGTVRMSYPAASSTKPGAGTWNVGFCVLNNGGSVAISNNDFVNGWVMVTN